LEDVLNLLRACPTLEKVTLCRFPKVHTELLSMVSSTDVDDADDHDDDDDDDDNYDKPV
jgi:hypothetical protein